MWNKEIIVIKQGQFLTGRKQLAKETGINEATIENILKLFENEHQISQQKTTKFRIITVINYKIHQHQESKSHQISQQSNNRVTTESQQNNTNKNNKKDNKKKNIIPFDGDTHIFNQCRNFFINHSKQSHNQLYQFDGAEGRSLKLLLVKLKPISNGSLENCFKSFISNIKDKWILEHWSLKKINSQFIEITQDFQKNYAKRTQFERLKQEYQDGFQSP